MSRNGEIRARYKKCKGPLKSDIDGLLNALDDAKDVSENAVRWCREMEADRDRWKARAEAMERWIKDNWPCWACKKQSGCVSMCWNECQATGGRFFEFDQARFAASAAGGNDEK